MTSGFDSSTSKPPRVTVATVTFNSAQFVRQALDSVLAQDFDDFELLVCDDASTDRTWELIAGYTDRRLRAVRNSENLGEYANRNQALRLARGRYLYFLDGDDRLAPRGLREMVRALDAAPSAGFAAAQPESSSLALPRTLSPHEFLACVFLGPTIHGANFTQLIFRTEALRSCGGFDPRFRTGDTHVQLVLGARYGCVLIPGGLAHWRERAGQASRALHADRWGMAEMCRYGCEVLDAAGCPLTAPQKRRARGNLARLLARGILACVREGRLAHAARLAKYSSLGPLDLVRSLSRNPRPYRLS